MTLNAPGAARTVVQAELGDLRRRVRSGLVHAWPRGAPAIEYITRTAHSEAPIVRGTGCDVDDGEAGMTSWEEWAEAWAHAPPSYPRPAAAATRPKL